jgi:alkylated DNA repair dioxygenase AlkB
MPAVQPSLLGLGTPAVDPRLRQLRRHRLDEASWIDRVPGWVEGHETLFDELERGLTWRAAQRTMYDRVVDVPRLFACPPDDGDAPPVVDRMQRALARHYGVPLGPPFLALYRDGRDGVAWHRDRELRELDDTLVAVVSLGGPRRFLLRPRGGGRSLAFTVGWGDLVVMGGACQRDWEHSVPKARRAEPRLAIMFRYAAKPS